MKLKAGSFWLVVVDGKSFGVSNVVWIVYKSTSEKRHTYLPIRVL